MTAVAAGLPRDELLASEAERRAIECWLSEFTGRPARVAVERRVSAATIGGALQAMVEGRRLDRELEQIERAAGDS